MEQGKPFDKSKLVVENLALKKLTKIEQRSSAKYNKEFNWTNNGWANEGTHTGLALSYQNERMLSFSLQHTTELTSVMIGFIGIL